jgi:ribonuclease HI
MGKKSFSKAAFHLITGIPDLSHQRWTRMATELFVKLNSREPPSSHSLHSRLLQESKHNDLPTILENLAEVGRRRSHYWVTDACKALTHLNITMAANPQPWFSTVVCIVTEQELIPWGHWKQRARQIYVPQHALFHATKQTTSPWAAYTDGSTPTHGQGPSGVGVYLVHPDIDTIRISEPFKASGNNFAAELMAILIAIRVVPRNHALNIYTDSQSCIYAITKDLETHSERQWIRTAARCIVRSIHKLMQTRTEPTRFIWVPSHSGSTDVHSKGNAEADKLANQARENVKEYLSEYHANEEQVIARITPTRNSPGNERKGEEEASDQHIPGDIREEAKRECERQHLRKLLSEKSGQLVKSNPADALHLFRVLRRKQNPAFLDFTLQCFTQTADTFTRRSTVKTQDQPQVVARLTNQWCLLCEEKGHKVEESTRHIFTCPSMLLTRQPEYKRIKDRLDPLQKLEGELQWFLPRQGSPNLLQMWDRWICQHEHPESEALPDQLKKIQQHDTFAGILGIMPPGIHDVLLAYQQKYSPTPMSEAQVKTTRKDIATLVEDTRSSLVELAFDIWSKWQTKKREYLRLQQTITKHQRKLDVAERKKQKMVKKKTQRIKNPVVTLKIFTKREARPRVKKPIQPSKNIRAPRKRPDGRDHARRPPRPRRTRGNSMPPPRI